MKDINKENYLQKLFIDEAKASFSRFSGGNSEELIAEVTEQIAAVTGQLTALEGRVTALEPSTNLFNFKAFAKSIEADTGYGIITYNDTASVEFPAVAVYYTNGTLKDFCPDLEIGETYILAFEYSDWYGTGGGDVMTYDNTVSINYPFVLTEELYNQTLCFYQGHGYEDDGTGNTYPYPGSGTYSHIRLNKGTEALPYEPYKG